MWCAIHQASLIKRQCDMRLSDTRFARKDDHPAFLSYGMPPPAHEQIYLFLTPE